MVDIKKKTTKIPDGFIMKEFTPGQKINTSAKKREKRKQKKTKELELKTILEERKRKQ